MRVVADGFVVFDFVVVVVAAMSPIPWVWLHTTIHWSSRARIICLLFGSGSRQLAGQFAQFR